MTLTAAQTTQLLKPIHPSRVLKLDGHSHVSQQDIAAHLIRVFGFCSFDVEVLETECIFETARPLADKYNGGSNMTDEQIHKAMRYDICYRSLVRLTIRDADGKTLAKYENGSTATAQNQNRGDGHDLAYKSAISLSVKRCAINLGDQFGLSLYNNGQVEGLVRGTLVGMPAETDQEPPADMQEGVPQQVSLGNDETEPPPVEPDTEPEPPAPAPEKPEPAPEPDPLRKEYDDMMALAVKNKQKAAIGRSLENPKTDAAAFAAWSALDAESKRLLLVIAENASKK